MKARRRPAAAVLAGSALIALLSPGAAVAQDGREPPREVTGGYASWTTGSDEPAERGVELSAGEGAVQGGAHRTWFPASGGGADPETREADVAFDGTARLTRAANPAEPLLLDALRLRLTDAGGTLYVRTELGGERRDIELAGLGADGAAPAVRAAGVTWTGLRASLTDEGARLLSAWSGQEFAAGDALGVLDVTVGTGAEPSPEQGGAAGDQGPADAEQPTGVEKHAPAATVARPVLTAGGEQEVTGEGFEPGAVVLVAVDGDTRYQAVADARGRVARTFPVYANATEGEHTVELSTVTGGRGGAEARFSVLQGD
ncbi:HtaA domain-containing protein [Streptomyces sp. NPDC003362]